MTFVLLLASCNKTSKLDMKAYQQEIEQWQKKRTERIASDDNWLTVVGLFWLKEGENKFGSYSSNEVILPAGKTPSIAGSLWFQHGEVRMEAKPKTEIKHKDSLVTSIVMQSDADGLSDPTILSIGSVNFFIIKRADKIGVRVKDKESFARQHFKGLEFFPIDPNWRVEAKYEPYNPPRIIPVATVINTVENDSCPGAVVFELNGKQCRLDAVIERGASGQLYFMFKDETSGKETYNNGRQLYSDLPNSDNNVILDFNKAYNWPCVYTDYATCPIPPPQNRLALRIEAGEKMYRGHH